MNAYHSDTTLRHRQTLNDSDIFVAKVFCMRICSYSHKAQTNRSAFPNWNIVHASMCVILTLTNSFYWKLAFTTSALNCYGMAQQIYFRNILFDLSRLTSSVQYRAEKKSIYWFSICPAAARSLPHPAMIIVTEEFERHHCSIPRGFYSNW